MINSQFLEPTDVIDENDWCRPLSIISMSGGHSDSYSFKNAYSGTPENNAEWVKVKCVIGQCWIGKTVQQYTRAVKSRFEFVRGDVPKGSKLSMKGYTDLSKFKQTIDDNFDDDIPF